MKKVKVKELHKDVAKMIVGQKIVGVHLEETNDEHSYSNLPLVVLRLANDVNVYAQADDEFNASGIMIAMTPEEKETLGCRYFLNHLPEGEKVWSVENYAGAEECT